MELGFHIPQPKRITAAPAGRGQRHRPDVMVNLDYVRKLLEEGRLTERDETLITFMTRVPILSSRQIKRLVYVGLSDSNMHRRLRDLFDYHVLDRTRMVSKLEGITYTLGKAGKLWVYGEARSSPPKVDPDRLEHDLGVAEIMVLLIEALRQLDPEGRIGLSWEWWSEADARLVRDAQVVLEPDAFFRVNNPSFEGAAFYLEFDRATERGQSFVEKVKRYVRVRVSLKEWRQKFEEFPAILVVTTSDERAANLAQVIARYQNSGPKSGLIWAVAPLARLQQAGLFRAEWQVVQQSEVLPRQRIQLRLVSGHNKAVGGFDELEESF